MYNFQGGVMTLVEVVILGWGQFLGEDSALSFQPAALQAVAGDKGFGPEGGNQMDTTAPYVYMSMYTHTYACKQVHSHMYPHMNI